MTTPPTIQTNPLGPSPFQVAITQGDRVTNAWNQWFTQAQQKINVINLTLATLSGGSITPEGYLAITSGGTSAGTATDAFNNLSPLTTNGDMLIYNSGNIRLPAGTDGYVLQVVSGIPTWVSASAGSSPLTTKGDVYGFNTAPARIPVGADSYVLTADSTNSLGVSWKPAGTPTLPITTKGDILGYSTVPARIPVGTDGTALIADSTQSLGVNWGSPAGTSPLTTKGDLYGFSTINARIPVGADGTFLVADSTQATGVRWGTGGVIVPNYVTTVLADSPIAFWQLNETSGTTATDSSGNSHNGTYTGTVNLGVVPAINLPGATYLPGAGSIIISYGSWMVLTTLTLEAWVYLYTPATTRQGFISRPQVSSGGVIPYSMETSFSSGNAGIAQFNGSIWQGAQGTFQLSTQNWYHLVGTLSGGVFNFYVNGLLATTPSSSFTGITDNGGNMTLGDYFNSSTHFYLNGVLSCCAVYGAALTPAQVSKHYSVGSIPGWL